MRRAAQLVLVFLASALVTLAIIMSANLSIGPQRPRRTSEAPADKITPQARSATARLLAMSGRLREAQDAYLEILQANPADPVAMEELVAVRRRLAADDPAALRRQAAAYRQAIAQGGETPEHYSRDSLEILAAASLRAAAVIESTRGGAHRTGTIPTTRGMSGPRSPDVPASRVPKRVQPAAPPPPPAATPQPQPPSTSAPASPAPPAAGADNPAAPADTPAAGTSPAPAEVQETVAVLAPPGEPAVAPSQGSLVGIDCPKRTFVLRGANGDEEFFTTPTVTIYVRGAPSHRLPDFCGLQSYLGHAVTAWTDPGGDRRIAHEVSVAP